MRAVPIHPTHLVDGQVRCGGAGEIYEGVGCDEFGNWDTECYPCPGCWDCDGVESAMRYVVDE